jgi:hypothetical protein
MVPSKEEMVSKHFCYQDQVSMNSELVYFQSQYFNRFHCVDRIFSFPKTMKSRAP